MLPASEATEIAMGKYLGSHDSDELDRPDLNKCPECGSFFAPEDDTCPICGAFCPEEFRAGNRRPVKAKKQAFSRASSRVTFVEWYHSWWFIIIALFFMPLIGVVLLITSPHKTKHKLIFVAAALLYTVLVSWGVGGMLIGMVQNRLDPPVNTALSMQEYIAACEPLDAQVFYRGAEAYTGVPVAVTLTVRGSFTDPESVYSSDGEHRYYRCTDDGETFTVLVRDCVLENRINLIAGDRILIYGEGAGNISVYDADYTRISAPALNAAYIMLAGEEVSQ